MTVNTVSKMHFNAQPDTTLRDCILYLMVIQAFYQAVQISVPYQCTSYLNPVRNCSYISHQISNSSLLTTDLLIWLDANTLNAPRASLCCQHC